MSSFLKPVVRSAEAAQATVELGTGPWATAWRKLRVKPAAWSAVAVIVLITAAAVCAPLYLSLLSPDTAVFNSNINGTTVINGEEVDLLQSGVDGSFGVTPIGPTWDLTNYFLGADAQGRDVMARILFGGANSLLIGGVAAFLCCLVGGGLGVIAGFFGGITDSILSRLFDVLWAFPVYLLAISLSIILVQNGFSWGPINLESDSLMIPTLIIALIYVPYVARPIRAQTVAIKNRTFVKASTSLGSSRMRTLVRDVIPNVLPSLLVYIPIMIALCMLIEAALSFLGVGVQEPEASWGTIINDGLAMMYTRPMVALVPGLLIAATAAAFNILGDALRDSLEAN
ncbi:ABC transporter permease [Leucobacter salsicius]|uniref:ABC transporter permease n=1 Tax=Leucobacter salsicius TaxID=664638 RepID=UPI00036F4114